MKQKQPKRILTKKKKQIRKRNRNTKKQKNNNIPKSKNIKQQIKPIQHENENNPKNSP